MKKDQFKANLYYVTWICFDGEKLVPYIDNKGFTKIKNILTGEIAPRQLLLDKVNGRSTTNYDLDSDLARQIANADSVDLLSVAELEEDNRNFVKMHASFLDRYTDKITRDIVSNDGNNNNNEYTLEQYAHFTKVLEKALAKRNDQRKKDQQKYEDFQNQFNF